MTGAAQGRVAVYYAPAADDPLWRAGCGWLGRDAASGAALDQPDGVCGLAAVTHDPRRYGFHATLKAPFGLRAGVDFADVVAAAAATAATMAPFAMPPLQVGLLDGFLALLATAPSAPLQCLADAIVERLDPLRAPLTGAELDRRAAVGLSPAQTEMLAAWGYPDVFGQWRFHMTLSRRLSAAQAVYYAAAAEAHFGQALARGRMVRDVCLFRQVGGGVLKLVDRVTLGG